MQRNISPTAVSAVHRPGVLPIVATLLALACAADPAHALLEGGSSAPLPTAPELALHVPEPELWLSPTARAREAWHSAVCTGALAAAGGYGGDYVRSANGTLLPGAMAPLLSRHDWAEPLRPVRRPSYVLASDLVPRDPATVRPARRPLPEPDRFAGLWPGPVVRTAAFAAPDLAAGPLGGASGIDLWRADLCNGADSTMTMAHGGLTGLALLPAAQSDTETDRLILAQSRGGSSGEAPTLLTWTGGGSGGSDGPTFLLVPGFVTPQGDPAFRPPSGPGNGGPGAPPWPPGPGTPPGGPPTIPPGLPPAADPAPVPLPAPLLLLLTACAGLLFGRRIFSAMRAS